MAKVELLAFGRTALEMGRAVLPAYRSRFSKHRFTQLQLLAIPCLMRYEEWTLREAEVRSKEHEELRCVLGLRSVPDFTTLHRFIRREGVWVEPKIKLLFGCRGCSCAIPAEE